MYIFCNWLRYARHSLITTEAAHSSVGRAATLATVRMRSLPTDAQYTLRGATLAAAMEEDIKQGLVPFCVSQGFALLP